MITQEHMKPLKGKLPPPLYVTIVTCSVKLIPSDFATIAKSAIYSTFCKGEFSVAVQQLKYAYRKLQSLLAKGHDF
jgi:hypothetical protein